MPADRVTRFLSALGATRRRHHVFLREGSLDVGPGRVRPWAPLSPQGDVELENLAADWPNRGWGRAALGVLEGLADLHGVSIFLAASATEGQGEPCGPSTLAQHELEGFYTRHGFVVVGTFARHTHMLRHPRRLNRAAATLVPAAIDEEPRWMGLPMPGENAAQTAA